MAFRSRAHSCKLAQAVAPHKAYYDRIQRSCENMRLHQQTPVQDMAAVRNEKPVRHMRTKDDSYNRNVGSSSQ